MLLLDWIIGCQFPQCAELFLNNRFARLNGLQEQLVASEGITALTGLSVQQGQYSLVELVENRLCVLDRVKGFNKAAGASIRNRPDDQKARQSESKTTADFLFN